MRYKIIDIIHTGHHGIRWESKVGYKYDQRRGMIINLSLDDCIIGQPLMFVNDKGYLQILTTPFKCMYYKGNYFYIETLNSIYELELINE